MKTNPKSSEANEAPVPGFREVPRTGVIYVVTEAARRGYSAVDPSWTNLGQGMPETGPLPGGPPLVVVVDGSQLALRPNNEVPSRCWRSPNGCSSSGI